ncbi:MAG: hypothetical protein OXQ29_05840 [Rhodospirillaceae bacterium]|nr:hypothetical protein [Rhodospirillaceae bacterium]
MWLVLALEFWAWSLPYFSQGMELHALARALSDYWTVITVVVVVTMIPVLWVARSASVRRSMAWGVGSATFAVFVLPIVALFASFFVPADHYPCSLPSVETSLPSRTIDGIETTGFFDDTCPVPIAREQELDRAYGVINLYLWGSPHRLRISARTHEGEPIWIWSARSDNVRLGGSRLPSDSIVFTFQGRHNFLPSQPPVPEETATFPIRVSRPHGELLEEIELRYAPVVCTCAFYDSL